MIISSFKINTTFDYDEIMIKNDIRMMIWASLGNEHLTTNEVADRLSGIFKYKCPDSIAKTLIRYRGAGLIKGEISMECGGWVWWVDDECRSRGVKDDS